MNEVSDRWLSVDEVAYYLGVSKDTIYDWLEKEGLPGHKVVRLWRFKSAEIDAWVKGRGNSQEKSNKRNC